MQKTNKCTGISFAAVNIKEDNYEKLGFSEQLEFLNYNFKPEISCVVDSDGAALKFKGKRTEILLFSDQKGLEQLLDIIGEAIERMTDNKTEAGKE